MSCLDRKCLFERGENLDEAYYCSRFRVIVDSVDICGSAYMCLMLNDPKDEMDDGQEE